ncbi:hypothetical protein GALL_415130 [mine drainage metagenome]|uniref:NAD-specific glutamate dehydrogenase n=1 Tax=mine drainage metagenome TaxID=410659 RepID=A0A1J5PZA4_9ZZZZ
MHVDQTQLVGALHFGHIDEAHAFTLGAQFLAGHVVETQHDILRRHDDRLAVGGRQHVVGCQHQGARFHLRFQRQRYVDGHLVAVKVGVERGANQRMQLDGLAFDQCRLERLDAQSVQGRRTVEQHRMLADHVLEDVPDFWTFLFYLLLGSLDGGCQAQHFQLVENERLEQFQRHLLGQTALMQLELRTNHDHRAAGIVDALAQQILTETTALALDHVGQRLQRTLVGAGHGLAAAAVVQQRIHGFLQHALFVAHDDFRGLQFQQALEAVVAVDDATIQIVQVGSRKTAAVERHQRTQFRRQHRQHFQDHPLWLDAGLLECFQHLEALGNFLDLGFGTGFGQFATQFIHHGVEVHGTQQFTYALGAHDGVEFVAVFFHLGQIVVFGQQLAARERRHARVDHDVGLEVQHPLDVAQCNVQHHAQAARQRLQEPDVRNRGCQFDVAHAFAPHLGQGHFDAALLADHAAMLETLVLAAQALVVLGGPEDLGAEQAIPLRLEGAVIDGFRLLHFAVRPGTDLLGGSQRNLDCVEFFFLGNLLE